MKSRKLFLYSSLAFGCAFALVPLNDAAPVTINNFSFETPTVNDGGFVTASGANGGATSGTFAGFGYVETTAGGGFRDFGIENPSAGEYIGAGGNGTPSGADGANVVFLNQSITGGKVNIFQDTGTLAANTTYTLTIAVGQRGDRTQGAVQIALLNAAIGNADPFGTGTILVTNTVGGGAVGAGNGIFTDYSVVFTTGNTVVNDLYVGAQYTGDGNIQASLDNIRLDATAVVGVPEPSTWLGGAMLSGLGIFAFVSARRRVSEGFVETVA